MRNEIFIIASLAEHEYSKLKGKTIACVHNGLLTELTICCSYHTISSIILSLKNLYIGPHLIIYGRHLLGPYITITINAVETRIKPAERVENHPIPIFAITGRTAAVPAAPAE